MRVLTILAEVVEGIVVVLTLVILARTAAVAAVAEVVVEVVVARAMPGITVPLAVSINLLTYNNSIISNLYSNSSSKC
jgi:urea transporter